MSLIVGFFGSIIGTYAWYTYKSSVEINYSGTAIGEKGGLRVGLISEKRNTQLVDKFGLEEDTVSLPNNYIYWSGDGLTAKMTSCYSENLGYASSVISPVTSGPYLPGDKLNLDSAPSYLYDGVGHAAEKQYYSRLRLAFQEGTSTLRSYLHIQKCDLKCDNDEICNAVRVNFETPKNTNNFIFNPSTENDGIDEVAGVLNLDKDKYFDYGEDKKEFIYGYTESASHKSEPYQKDTKDDEHAYDTFHAMHREGVYGAEYEAKTATYYGTKTTIENSEILTSPDLSTAFSELTMTVYLEGWNKSMVDTQEGHNFSLELVLTA